jgi:hypothetical protein
MGLSPVVRLWADYGSVLMRSNTMGTTSPGLGREEQGAYQESPHSA